GTARKKVAGSPCDCGGKAHTPAHDVDFHPVPAWPGKAEPAATSFVLCPGTGRKKAGIFEHHLCV
ncbi:hypothetical protein O5629_27655, partial [Escherichia coli]|nr:hypothetical protein [Escherichia coli]